ncbi:MAG TPA: glycine zipper 2TM domain-containing protein [Gammaproteobacteria bacterium]|nr:glycine zipper 2TM domain-containing protein [Gammaproteobacteria bacterium]
MNKLMTGTVTLLLAATLTTGCSWDKRDTGTAAGAVVGGVAGNLVTGGSAVGTGIGAVGGALVGNQLAK